ncbi:integrase core domain-containing protein [Autumnicola edwardsiae]|uniref:Integrase core domain-containing protein n=1 Tax=Autumnicola edwardsiae TaxID=3075594 RepID=A0ABU3CRS9_9FLAO|nr:integrase core domain-containing protein [Zunongwangia sp. F297]MDT0648991.1 integrase core domain-containing protein [Zunongwangia sp. F297]
MGGKAWENANAESLNGILKNEYINFSYMDITLTEVRKMIKRWFFFTTMSGQTVH